MSLSLSGIHIMPELTESYISGNLNMWLIHNSYMQVKHNMH